MQYTIEVVRVPVRHLAVKRFTAATPEEIGPQMQAAFGAVMHYAGIHGVRVEGPAVGHYTRSGTGFDVAAGFVVREPIDGAGDVVGMDLPAGEVATTTHIGLYRDLSQAYDAIVAWAADNERPLDEHAMWEEYWTGPEVPESEQRTVLCWPLQPATVPASR